MSRDLPVTSRFVGSFDEHALLEPSARAYQSDEVRENLSPRQFSVAVVVTDRFQHDAEGV